MYPEVMDIINSLLLMIELSSITISVFEWFVILLDDRITAFYKED